MRLPRFVRTTSFRLTLLYAGLFCASVLLLFGAMFWFGTGYVAEQIDKTVLNEMTEIKRSAGGQNVADLRFAIALYAKDSPPGVYYLLQDSQGRVLAGNMPPITPIVGIRRWSAPEDGGQFPLGDHAVRGRGELVGVESFFFVGPECHELHEKREMDVRAFVWGFAGTVALALIGGTIMSIGLLRRVEAISRTSRDIVAGDLSRRMPLQGSNDEFDHLAQSLNVMLDRIQSLMDGLQQVSNDIAHDLRTPLSRLRQRLEIARRRSCSVNELHVALDDSIQEVDTILETFGALLRIAQIEAHTSAVGLAPFDLSGVLNDMVETYQVVSEERRQTLIGEIEAGLTINADRELLPQLFSNLIENAVRHCPQDAKISVRARRMENQVEVSVSDNGPGIPADMREQVFRRFFRLERSRTTEGTGLGLSLASAVAHLHGASITLLDNDPGLTVQMLFSVANS